MIVIHTYIHTQFLLVLVYQENTHIRVSIIWYYTYFGIISHILSHHFRTMRAEMEAVTPDAKPQTNISQNAQIHNHPTTDLAPSRNGHGAPHGQPGWSAVPCRPD